MLSSTAIGVYEFIIRVLSGQIKFRATGRPCSNHRARNESMTRRHIQYGGVLGEGISCDLLCVSNWKSHQPSEECNRWNSLWTHLHVYTCRLERVAGSQLVIRPSAQPWKKEAICMLSWRSPCMLLNSIFAITLVATILDIILFYSKTWKPFWEAKALRDLEAMVGNQNPQWLVPASRFHVTALQVWAGRMFNKKCYTVWNCH